MPNPRLALEKLDCMPPKGLAPAPPAPVQPPTAVGASDAGVENGPEGGTFFTVPETAAAFVSPGADPGVAGGADRGDSDPDCHVPGVRGDRGLPLASEDASSRIFLLASFLRIRSLSLEPLVSPNLYFSSSVKSSRKSFTCCSPSSSSSSSDSSESS
jgi:hypothetical protein